MKLFATTIRHFSLIAFMMFALSVEVSAQGFGPSTGKYLYTEPDPSAQGGISGTIRRPARAIVEIFASPASDPEKVFRGTVIGRDRQQFSFTGLPAAKYDLCVLYKNSCLEGLTLSRDDDTLTGDDKLEIKRTIEKSEMFFEKKKIHRIEGQTGRGSEARAFVEYLRYRYSVDYEGSGHDKPRRSLKLLILKHVGPGWQIVRSREFDVRFFARGGSFSHKYRNKLNRIRVIDSAKDLGDLDLQMK